MVNHDLLQTGSVGRGFESHLSPIYLNIGLFMSKLLHVSLRQQAIYIPKPVMQGDGSLLKGTTATLIANLAQ